MQLTRHLLGRGDGRAILPLQGGDAVGPGAKGTFATEPLVGHSVHQRQRGNVLQDGPILTAPMKKNKHAHIRTLVRVARTKLVRCLYTSLTV